MFFRNIKIGLRLGLGFSMIIVLVVIVSMITISYMKTLSDLTTKLYNHPFAVSRAILRIDGNIVRMHRSMKDVALALQDDEIQKAVVKVNSLEKIIIRDFAIVHDRFLGSEVKVEDARNSFIAWKPIRDEVIELMYAGRRKEAADITKGKGAVYVEQLSKNIDEFIQFAQGKADSFLRKAEQSRSRAFYLTYTFLLGTTIIVILFAFFFTRSITAPLSVAVKTSNELAEGNLSINIPVKSKDEVGQLLSSMKNLANKLLEATQENERQDWLKTGQNELNEKMRGEMDERALSHKVITSLAKHLSAQIGAIYLTGEEEPDSLKFCGSYAFSKCNGINEQFKVGEGLVGQAAFEKEMISITNIPETYARIHSAIGDEVPSNLVITPLLYENQLRGVIELGSFKEFSNLQMEFLSSISESVAISINTAQSRTKMKNLLDKTQSQAERLQSQQEKLRISNEELEVKQQQVEKQNKGLEQARQELGAKAKALELSGKYKSEFLANMSHELRTPLNSILLLSELLKENKENNLNDKQVEFATTIHTSGSDLLDLINEVLDLAKVEAGKMVLHIDDVKLEEISEHIRHNFQPQVENKGISLRVEIGKDLPALIRTDHRRLEQILNNFLSNALKFTSKGTITFSIYRPEPEAVRTLRFVENGLLIEHSIAFSVSDTGLGIPDDKQQVVFEPFQQADGGTSRKYGGTGLGLSISKKMAILLKGAIGLQSEEGKGSAFTLYLPEVLELERSIGDSESKISNRHEATESQPEGRIITKHLPLIKDDLKNTYSKDEILDKKTIMLVDDDARNVYALTRVLESKGAQVIKTFDGKSALEQLEANPDIHLVLMDIMMPEMNGYECITKIRKQERFRKLPIIAVTAKAMKEDRMKCLEVGANDYLSKPVDTGKLLSMLRVRLDQ